MMLLVYASRTSNISKIVDKLNLKSDQILDISEGYSGEVSRDFVLLTYTDFLGSVPFIVEDFLSRNSNYMKGVAGSGNRNFGRNFCGAARKISKDYEVPLLATFELSGNDQEIEKFKELLVG